MLGAFGLGISFGYFFIDLISTFNFAFASPSLLTHNYFKATH
jgi:hypothetical protein